jgi:uncharacterized protein YecE (DUF72 family)
MNLHIGTSGFGYREWLGKFYPAELKPHDLLPFYSARFSAVEINTTFYRMPVSAVLESWLAQVPENFLFTFKAPASITHRKRLRDIGEETAAFLARIATLGPQLGPVLFQLPPSLRCDLSLLRDFLDAVPRVRMTLEFRHASWFNEEVFGLLREQQCALCVSDRDDTAPPPFVATAEFGYVRLRRSTYNDEELGSWRERILAEGWPEAFVFFRHEETASGPAYAQKLLEGGAGR